MAERPQRLERIFEKYDPPLYFVTFNAARRRRVLAAKPPHWQEGFFDHLIRNPESYEEKWSYVRENPVRAGLVDSAERWPYAGEIVSIDRA